MASAVLDSDLLMRYGNLMGLMIQHGPTTRARLMELTGSAQPTITRWVGDLLDVGLVREMGVVDDRAGSGRPAAILDIVPDAGYVGAFHLTRTEVELGVVNLKGKVVARRVLPIAAEAGGQARMAEEAATSLGVLLRERCISPTKLIGVGVATDGPIGLPGEADTPFDLVDDRLIPGSQPIYQALQERFELPISVETNAWAMALGERWFGSGESDFVFVYTGDRIGGALVVDGRLHRGRGRAGLIGHAPVERARQLTCACGRTGCAAAFLRSEAVLSRLSHPGLRTLEEAAERANSGDPEAHFVFLECASVVAEMCVPYIDLVDPDALVLAGPLYSVVGVPERIDRVVSERSILGGDRDVKVLSSTFGKDVGLIGAGSLVYDQIYR